MNINKDHNSANNYNNYSKFGMPEESFSQK